MAVKQVLTESLHSHPVVEAWRAATSLDRLPAAIHVLRERDCEAIYLLPGIAPDGGTVVAKRLPTRRLTIESTVYEQLLPRLPLTAPRCYGSWFNDSQGWLFVEHVGVERYCPTDPEQFAAAARWLGTLHATAAEIPSARSLPDAGPARYLTHLRHGRERILTSLDTFPYASAEAEELKEVLARCASVEARWDMVEAACEGVPATLVHGDFQSKNVYLRSNGVGRDLYPIDWETVGWGVPAADLADLRCPRVDLTTYWTVVREFRADIGFDAVERLAATGSVLSGCAEFDWKCATLLTHNPRARSSALHKLAGITDLLAHAAQVTASPTGAGR